MPYMQIPGSLDEDAVTRTSSGITKEDVRKMQVLLRILTNSDYKTPTSVLIQKTKLLSVHQQMAQLSLSQVYNIYKTKLPADQHQQIICKHRR